MADWLRRLHLLAAIGWAVMIPVSIITSLRNSLPYLVGLSVYASHLAAWAGSRAETNGDS